MARLISALLLAAGIVAGTLADRPIRKEPLTLGGYRVIAADFHTHSSLWSNGMLTPWGLVLEAERQGLDALAVTGHNEVWDAKVARAFSRAIGGPEVVIGQEVHNVDHHAIALGIERVVDFRLPVVQQIARIHEQGGVAIAAHPVRFFFPGFDDAAVRALDGTEICHPAIYYDPRAARELEWFSRRGAMAAIGSSDFHGWGRVGDCRTYVFATDASAGAIVEAIRAHRTVVYNPYGRVYGDPALIALADAHPELRVRATELPRAGALDWISRVAGLTGLVGVALTGRRGR
jgi:predicted metal-dependent phosphoesterase TrpH